MKRYLLAISLVVLVAGPVWADDAKKDEAGSVSAADKLQANPNDLTALNTYLNDSFRRLAGLIDAKPDEAEKQVKEMGDFLTALKADSDQAKQQITRAKSVLTSYTQRIELARTSLEELEKRIKDNADDLKSVSSYAMKITQEVGPLTRRQPDVADTKLKAGRSVLNEAKAQAKQDATKQQIDRFLQQFGQLEKSIEAGKKLTALVGTRAVPFTAAAWVNGKPLMETDLKGKVVLLDFWAVWCGPCIATFPHLREWNEKYAEKGLVIVGMTKYYNFGWDEATGRASRSQEKIAPEAEEQMLVRFAEQHKLKHRFAVQADNQTAEHYGVTGIPHVVVIDREGVVRLIRVGSGPDNARDIGELLEKLLAAET